MLRLGSEKREDIRMFIDIPKGPGISGKKKLSLRCITEEVL